MDGGGPRPSPGCARGSVLYPPGVTTLGSVDHGGLTRTLRVHVPPGYDGASPLPLVLMFHGGGGSGEQFELRSSGMSTVADREGFIAVYPDGTGRIQTWNGGNDVDDVGFTSAMLDHLGAELCVDERRVFAAGMSNGAIMSHRLACELSERLAAVAPVAGTEMSPTCTPSRGVAVMHIHGSDDGHVPFEGGLGCGPSGVAYTSIPATMERRRVLNGCAATTSRVLVEGDGTCEGYDACDEDVVLCTIAGGGHNWPGGAPPGDLVPCPGNGGQSTTFIASEVIWHFFAGRALAP
jgi:polyhydroxybutyrate depolymerase